MFPSGNTSTPTTGSLFGGGDGAKPFQAAATPSGQDNKQNVFGSQAFGSFKFGAKTSTPAASNLFSPASSGTSFSTAKPAFDFASPPNQTVGSPGFGAPQQQQQQPQNLSFGATQQPQQQQTQQQQPAPAFGTAAQTTSSFSFGKPAGTTSAFSFATPTSSFPAPAQQAAATTSSAPQSTQSFFSPTATTSASAAPAFGQGFGGGFGFAASSVASTLTSSLASTTPAPTSLSISTPALSTTSAPATGFSFGQSTVSFVPAQATTTTTAQQSQPTGLSTTTSGFSFAPKGTLNFGTTQASATTPSLAPASQPTPSLGSTTSQPVQSLGTTTAQPSLSLGTAPTSQTTLSLGTNTGLSTGLSFSKPTITAVSSAAPSTAATGLSFGAKPAATSAMVSLTTTTTTTAAAPPQAIASLTYAQLEENINKWTQKLEEQEKTFINQATQLNAWDRLVIANGEKIVELNDAVQTVKNEQESLEHEIGFVLAQQKELEELLAPMEKQLLEDPGDRLRDPEREHMYFLAENLDRQMRQMSEDLKEVIEHLNETNRSQDSNDPIVQIGRILNAHMSSMQWIDNSIAQISTKLDQLKATHDTLRRDNERSFQKTYN